MVIDNIECFFDEQNFSAENEKTQLGKDIPLFIWPNFHHQGNEIEHMKECLTEKGIDTPFIIVSFFVQDWNRDLSPWEAPAVFGDEKFGGWGEKTLQWIDESLIPYLKEKYKLASDSNLFMMGYSLAGLFSLWAMYEKDYFRGCVAASPSVWFPNWDKYVIEKEETLDKAKNHGKSKLVYLSIGNKEEKTRNAIMKTVGDRIRWQYKLLDENPSVNVIYEVNPGGHFADSGERISKGIAWILKDEKINN